MQRYLDPPALLGAAWATLALVATRRQLRRIGVRARVPAPPRLPAGATRGVDAVLHRLPTTCLERALIRQRWLAAHGYRHDVVIGVHAREPLLTAHAWLDELEPMEDEGFSELHRLSAPA